MTISTVKSMIGLFTFLGVNLLQPSALLAEPNDKALNAAVTRIYAPYKLEDSGKAIWDQPFFSASMRVLIRDWQRATKGDDVTELSSADWLCQCQDWDFVAFKVTNKQYKTVSANQIHATIEIDLGFDEKRKTVLILVREKGRWEIDDVINSDFPVGIKSELRSEIAASKKKQTKVTEAD